MVSEIRLRKLESVLKQRVANLLSYELSDPRASFITVTKVKLDREIKYCTIYYSVLGDEKQRNLTSHLLDHARGFIRKELAKVLHTRHVPVVRFEYDPSIESSLKLEKLIDEAAREAHELEGRVEKKEEEEDKKETE